jgi:hypothetical protein
MSTKLKEFMKQNKHSLIGKILCILGFHRWIETKMHVRACGKKLLRTYQVCERCGAFGKLLYFKELKEDVRKT